ncbi:hypothetical protein KM908_14450 [Alkalihalobacillus clausii]|uniref:hypothetical protein n=1 Tax=Shouchella clausii TaxID=79880 RepID=UPI001C21CE8B|nr:hypothetical protein [Shouchella clausii]MBU8597343.1 hypothetical protein [Shouchella clausii]
MSEYVIRLAYEKGYRVTEEGIVRGLYRNQLKIHVGTNGYPLFGIRDQGKNLTVPAHRFAAYCYFGEEVFAHECVRHVNGVKTDISRDNLVLGSLSDNYHDIPHEWRSDFARKGASTRRRLTECDVRSIRKKLADGESYRNLSKEYNVAKSTIQQIKEGKSYKWVI